MQSQKRLNQFTGELTELLYRWPTTKLLSLNIRDLPGGKRIRLNLSLEMDITNYPLVGNTDGSVLKGPGMVELNTLPKSSTTLFKDLQPQTLSQLPVF